MQLYDQIRTATGRYPTHDAHLESIPSNETTITFDFYSPQEFAALSADTADIKHRKTLPEVSIEDFAVIPDSKTIADTPGAFSVDEGRILDLARKSGPVFGQPTPERESDWISASIMACEIVSMQEVLNGVKPLGASKMPVVKSRVTAQNTGSEFYIYATSFDLGSADQSVYAASMPPLPWFKRFSQEGTFDYSFMQTSVESGNVTLTAYLLSFEREISLADFATVIAYFYDDPSIAEEAAQTIATEQQDILPDIGDAQAITDALGIALHEENLLVEDEELSEADYPHLQKLVYALVSLHLQGIRVDVFASSETDDFMVFDSFLSYLWYTFANELDEVKIGYCERCGNGFSLTGHRGIKRRFCSEKCKTEEKNARMKKRTDDERQRFWEGESVREIAQADARKEQRPGEAMDSVLAKLRTWKQLQHALDAAVVTGGKAAPFIRRCADEGVFSQDYVEGRAQKIRETPRIRKDAQHYAEDPVIFAAITGRRVKK